MLTISSGHSANYLLDAVAAGRESYYTQAVAAGEPPGRWYGAGAESLGLTGEVDADVMRAVYGEFRDPRDSNGTATLGNTPRQFPSAEEQLAKMLEREPSASPERRLELAGEAARQVRNNVAFYDATFSVPKSITVLHAAFESEEVAARHDGDDVAAGAWALHRVAVEAAIWAGNNAQLDYLMQHAGYTRVGDHSTQAGRWTDAHDWTVASFFQHDSRTHDPQLHVHNAILNRVQTVGGKWLTLSGRDLNLAKRAAGAVAERVMFEHVATTLGVQVAMRPDGKSREIVGVDQKVMDHFSTRTRALTPMMAKLAAEYEAAYGRVPNALQMSRFDQRATLATRPAKEYAGERGPERLARWDAELRVELGEGLAKVAADVLARAQEPQGAAPFLS